MTAFSAEANGQRVVVKEVLVPTLKNPFILCAFLDDILGFCKVKVESYCFVLYARCFDFYLQIRDKRRKKTAR